MCNLPLCVVPPFLVFGAITVTIHCFYLGITVQFTAFCTRAPGKKTMDVEIYSKKIKVKKLVLVTVPDLQQSRLQMAWEFVFRTGCAN